jgi:hypothetical protein
MRSATAIRTETTITSRRTLFTVVLGGALAASTALAMAPEAPKSAPRAYLVTETFIAGTAWTDFARALPGLAAGQRLLLKAEGKDKTQIAVYAGEGPAAGAKLGYLPRANSETLASLLSDGARMSATLTALDPASWSGAKIAVRLIS